MAYSKIYETEVGYWDKELSLKGDYPEDIIKRLTPERMKEIFPEILLPLISKFKEPRILDVGSGPVSMLNYVVENNLAKLIAVDPLAEEYHKLLLKYDYSIKYPMVASPGEELTKHFSENSFDITWIHNALDHSKNPDEVIKEMIKLTKYGGYIVIAGWENEGTFESFYGLHQHDLYLKKGELYLKTILNKDTLEFTSEKNITKDLPVIIHSAKITDKNGRKWNELILKKQCEVFHKDRKEENKNFFDALINSWLPIYNNPNFPLWGSFALTTNSRGRYVLEIIKKYIEVKGKDYLDIGTAYGGFPITFSKAGARSVMGIDINNDFIKLACENAKDNDLSSDTFKQEDITQTDLTSKLTKHFDIITLNDVIEHVEEPSQIIKNIYDLLKSKGIVYFEIPNKYYIGFVLKDGHYSLPGITLLTKKQAEKYYNLVFKNSDYSVGDYLTLHKYQQLFKKSGFTCEVIEETFASYNENEIKKQIDYLKLHKDELLKSVPEVLRSVVKTKLTKYIKNIDTCKPENFQLKYGVPFWKIILKKKDN